MKNLVTITLIGFLSTSLISKRLRDIPKGVESKNRISDEKLAKKQEGEYVTGIAGVTSDPDVGVGFAAVFFYYINGKKSDPYFAYSDFKHRIHASALVSTKGVKNYSLGWDAPFFLNSLFRIRSLLEYTAQPNLNYYGTGSQSLNPLSFAGKNYSSYKKFQQALRSPTGTTTTNAFYDKYAITLPRLKIFFEREMLGGLLRPQIGYIFSKLSVNDYSNKEIESIDGIRRIQQQTRLSIDNDEGLVTGFNGGIESIARLGFGFDTRDIAANPSKGMFHDFVIDFASPFLGSSFDYISYTLGSRGFYSLLKGLVMAGRFMYTVRTAGAGNQRTSFNALGNFSSTSVFEIEALGGFRSIRGFRKGRFRGNAMALMNLELRYTFYEARAWGQTFDFMVVPFVDTGSVFESLALSSLPLNSPWPLSGGLALRIVWNQVTVIMFDFAMSKEDSGFYINVGHIF